MLSATGYDPRYVSMLRDYGDVPSLNEQAAKEMLHPQRRHKLSTGFNAVVAWLLGSPLHWLLSRSVMLVTLRGHKSGHRITIPVNYWQERSGMLQTISRRDHKWWRNLTGGEPVTVRVRGHDHSAFSRVIADPQTMALELENLLVRVPASARALEIRRTAEGELRRDDLERAARQYVLVCTRLD